MKPADPDTEPRPDGKRGRDSQEHARRRARLKRLLVQILFATAIAVAVSARTDEVKRVPLLDESGRELTPGGYVVLEDIPCTADDSRRMVRMGANFQVIRMPIWTVGAWPARQPKSKAVAHSVIRHRETNAQESK